MSQRLRGSVVSGREDVEGAGDRRQLVKRLLSAVAEGMQLCILNRFEKY